INSALEIQGYIESAGELSIRLVGYTGGVDPVYFAAPPDVTPATTGSWTTIDVSAYVDADASGVILFLDATGASAIYGIRETGSSFSDTAHQLGTDSNTMYFVGIDENDKFDIYLQNGTINIYLIAHTDESVGYYVDDLDVTDPPLNLWEVIDADSYGVPATANGLILRAVNTQNAKNEFGLRKIGSSDDLNRTLTAQGHLQGPVGLDVGNGWEEFISNANVNVSIAAYTYSLNIDSILHADLDVIVRKSNGEIRATLGTGVANTANIGVEDGWVTVTATFTPGEYVIVDQTDYLEFVLYADITLNDSNATVEFRIDDNTIRVVEQTGVRNLGLFRE
ncbi:MAG: hypothetical protein IIC30_03190, partial [Chloroflexi bacterium]|nr:hypothetical protein [Chloroflexota bacterium]